MPIKSKLSNYVNYRIRVTMDDGRAISGTFLAHDKYMNLCIADAEEFRKAPAPKTDAAAAAAETGAEDGKVSDGSKEQAQTKAPVEREMKRTLGFVLLRGECVVSLAIEGPPPQADRTLRGVKRGPPGAPGTGVGRAVGRGVAAGAPVMNAPAAALAGPARGLGMPNPAAMLPTGGEMPPLPPGMQQMFANMAGMVPPGGRGFPPMPPGMPAVPPGMPAMPPGFTLPPGMTAPPMPPGFTGLPPGMPFPPGMAPPPSQQPHP